MAILADPPTPAGEDPAFLDMLAHVSQLAPLSRPTLVIGERGTGKELVAGRLAFLSPRWERPFISLNCAALPDTLLDAELFGHEAGSFTGAGRRRAGRFEAADGGTLFLDEVATASAAVQEKLLRVIEYGTFERVGSSQTVQVDVRVIAATNADLPAMAADGRFRADLLDRLAFDVIRVPPLRERKGDIMLLADRFARRMAVELGRAGFAGFTASAAGRLQGHDWPGNVRELRNVVERSVYRMDPPYRALGEIILDPFGAAHRPTAPPVPARRDAPPAAASSLEGGFTALTAAYATTLLRTALEQARFNQAEAARALGLSYFQFRHQMRVHGLAAPKRA